MSVLQRNRRREFSDDVVLSIQDYVARSTAGLISGGLRTDLRKNLSEAELSELVALTREAEKPDRRFVIERLSKRKAQRWEQLVGKGGGDSDFFKRHREMAEIQALAAQAHKARVRRPFTRQEEAGLLAELGEHLAKNYLSVHTLTAVVVVFAALERGEGFAPHSRVEREDGEPVLVVNRTYGLVAERKDWRQTLGAWRQGLSHAERNAWVEVDRSGGMEWRIRLGTRAKRAMRGAPPKKRAA
jgi:hypothetical protein